MNVVAIQNDEQQIAGSNLDLNVSNAHSNIFDFGIWTRLTDLDSVNPREGYEVTGSQIHVVYVYI